MALERAFFKKPIFFVVVFVLVQAGIFGVIVAFRDESVLCAEVAGKHTINVSREGFDPRQNTVQRCTAVRFVNQDSVTRQPAFGEYEKHISPAGFYEKALPRAGSYVEFVASQPGRFKVHDHIDHDLEAELIILP